MCTGAEIAIFATVAGGAFAADQQVRSGKQTQEDLEAQGAFARLQAAKKAARMRRSNAKFIARQRAGFASSGVVVGSGTPLAVVADTAAELELNALNVNLTGINAEARAVFQGKQARRAANVQAIGTLLSTAGTAATIGAAKPAAGGTP